MYPTVEVRWFYRGNVPLEVWAWFYTWERDAEEQTPRVDNYLRIVEGDGLGIKLREGRIEIKQRYGQQEIAHFGKKVEGYVERWCKWSYELAKASDMVAELNDNPAKWIGVKKTRKIHAFRVVDNQLVGEVSNCAAFDEGCTWEIVQVEAYGTDEKWWSVGLEAFGKELKLRDTLFALAPKILSIAEAPTLKLEDSRSYPSWLLQI